MSSATSEQYCREQCERHEVVIIGMSRYIN